jgi:Transmembrane secretion effector
MNPQGEGGSYSSAPPTPVERPFGQPSKSGHFARRSRRIALDGLMRIGELPVAVASLGAGRRAQGRATPALSSSTRRMRAWSDASRKNRVLEQFVVASWEDHLPQHETVTKRDQERRDRVREITDPAQPVTVTHWLSVNRAKRGP